MKKLLLLIFFLIVIVAGLFFYFSADSTVTENLDPFVYELPYKKGTAHKVVQGYGGRFSHKNKAALDFSMPEGTPIYAARGGVIYSYKDNSNKGGMFSDNGDANYIIIRHSDGSFGCYWHLQKDGVVTKKGKVTQGQLIGYSGSTGFVLRPHLHFTVKRRLNYEMNSFVQTKFRTANGNQLLERGKSYTRP